MFIGSVIPWLHGLLHEDYANAIIDAWIEGDMLDTIGTWCGV